MKTTLSFLFLFMTFHVIAQGQADDFTVPNYSAKTPEAASFLKYGEYAVNLSNGLPNISIPLYNIEVKGLTVPINLSYHASGVKVAQEADWVGLGWSLNYGAQVILNVKDDVDQDNAMINQIPSDASLAYYDTHPYAFNSGPLLSEQLDKSRVKDEYQFSSPTANGSFIMGENGPIVYPPDAFKVAGGPDGGFIITDASGIVYTLNVKEISRKEIEHSGNYVSAWFVSKIETPNNDVINFTYQDDGELVDEYVVQSRSVKSSYSMCGCPGASQTPVEQLMPTSTRIMRSTTQSKKISEISFNNGKSKVIFLKTSGREDLKNGNSKLSYVQIKQWNGSDYELVRGFNLVYSYFNPTASGNLAYESKRMYLNSVETLLEGDAYQLIYSNLPVPNKKSYGQDAYGYYNAKSNVDMIPPHQYGNYSIIGNGDRSINPAANQAGMLTKIIYPTKGATEFNYETNEFRGYSPIVSGFATISSSVTGAGPASNNPPDDNWPPSIDEQPPFTTLCPTCIQYSVYDFVTPTSGTLVAHFSNNLLPNESNLKLKYQFCRVRAFNSDGDELWNTGKKNIDVDLSMYLGGVAKIVLEGYGENVHVWTGFTYSTVTGGELGNQYGGGLRIKNIKNYNEDNILVLQKDYNYDIPGYNGASSGGLTNFLFTSYTTVDPINFTVSWCGTGLQTGTTSDKYTTFSSSSRGRTEANSVAYTYVKETVKNTQDSSQNGYTIYKFNTEGNGISDIPEVDYKANWRIGTQLEKTVFSYKNGTALPIRQEINTYDDDENAFVNLTGFKLIRRSKINVDQDPQNPLQPVTSGDCGTPTNVTQTVSFHKFNYKVPRYYLQSTKIIENTYDDQNQLAGTLTTVKTFKYDNPAHLQLTRETITSSRGEVVEKRYSYPGDSDVVLEPVVNDMVSKNILVPLRVQSFRNNVKLSERLTKYRNWGNGIIAPEFILGAKGQDTPENRIRFNSYDTRHGNPTELQMEAGTKISYIWGYDKSRAVAKIESLGYVSIPQTLIDAIQSASDTSTEADLLLQLDNLRNHPSLASAMVETYTYRPLGGLSVKKDARGNKTTYYYDNQERLVMVKDQDDNIVTENKYHFKN